MKRKGYQGPRWDDRVAIAIMLVTWGAMGAIGLYDRWYPFASEVYRAFVL